MNPTFLNQVIIQQLMGLFPTKPITRQLLIKQITKQQTFNQIIHKRYYC